MQRELQRPRQRVDEASAKRQRDGMRRDRAAVVIGDESRDIQAEAEVFPMRILPALTKREEDSSPPSGNRKPKIGIRKRATFHVVSSNTS